MQVDASDFATGFWSGWIIALTLLGLAFVAALLHMSARGNIQSDPEVWDDDLREGNAPPPQWWFWLFASSIIFSCAYLVLYPGLGGWRGALEWTQFSQHQQAQQYYDSRYSAMHEQWRTGSFSELAANPEAMTTAALLFADNCSACHGRQGRGQANMFPDLTDGVWQWGGADEEVHRSVREGRTAQMPSQLAALGGMQAAEAMADYVAAGLQNSEAHQKAAAQFAAVCATCHGADGRGNATLGAPDLTDDVWLYGNSREQILESFVAGRQGEMPAQKTRMDPARIRLLAAWIATGAINDYPPK